MILEVEQPSGDHEEPCRSKPQTEEIIDNSIGILVP